MSYKLLIFFMHWFFKNKVSIWVICFQSLIILFLMVLGFSQFKQPMLYFPSIFLISMFFMGQFFLIETHSRFAHQRTLQALILTGATPLQVYAALAIVSTLWVFLLGVVLWALMHIFFQASIIVFSPLLLAVLLSGTLSYVALGILFYGFAVFSRVEHTYVMILFFPLCIPLFLFFHHALASILTPDQATSLTPLLGMNLLFVFCSMLLYDFVAEELT